MMNTFRKFFRALIVLACAGTTLITCGKDPQKQTNTESTPNLDNRLYLMTAENGTLIPSGPQKHFVLSLEGVLKQLLWFTDRPMHEVGEESLEAFLGTTWPAVWGEAAPNVFIQSRIVQSNSGSERKTLKNGSIEGIALALNEPYYDDETESLAFLATLLNSTLETPPDETLAFEDVVLTVLNKADTGNASGLSFIQNAPSSSLESVGKTGEYELSLDDHHSHVLWLENVPGRDSGEITVQSFVEGWKERFSDSPPNASLVGLTHEGKLEVGIFTLMDPVFDPEADQVTYTASLLFGESDNVQSLQSVKLFVDAGQVGTMNVGFSPYVGQCVNNIPPSWCAYSLDDIKKMLTSVKNAGYSTIRTFDSGPSQWANQNSTVFNVQAAHALGGLKVWNCAALAKGNDTLSKKQIDTAIEQAHQYPNVVKGIIVGVEPVGLQGISMQTVIDMIHYAKQKRDLKGFTSKTLPITTSEQLGVLAGVQHRPIVKAVEDVLFANYYPFLACGITVNTAITDPDWGLDAKYKGLKAQITSYHLTSPPRIMIGETGWSSDGTNQPPPAGCPAGKTVPPAGKTDQQTYIAEVKNWAIANSVDVFLFIAFDEPWKNCDTNSIDHHWGVLTTPTGINAKPYAPCKTPVNP